MSVYLELAYADFIDSYHSLCIYFSHSIILDRFKQKSGIQLTWANMSQAIALKYVVLSDHIQNQYLKYS